MLFQYALAVVLVAQGCLAAPNARITDGDEAPPHQFPHQVSIVWGLPPVLKYRHMCGGSIIARNWILTAGHCITELPPFGKMAVHAGKHILNEHEERQQVSSVSLKVVYWKYPGGVAQHDIALLKLKTPLVFDDMVQPIKLPAADKIHTGEAILSGWGSISKELQPQYPSVLQTATVTLLDIDTCFAAFHELPGDPQIFDTQICSGPVGSSVSACSGDSGGPLIQYNDHEVPEIVGIVSWGAYPCGSGTPSVYTRVSAYVDWIKDKVEG